MMTEFSVVKLLTFWRLTVINISQNHATKLTQKKLVDNTMTKSILRVGVVKRNDHDSELEDFQAGKVEGQNY